MPPPFTRERFVITEAALHQQAVDRGCAVVARVVVRGVPTYKQLCGFVCKGGSLSVPQERVLFVLAVDTGNHRGYAFEDYHRGYTEEEVFAACMAWTNYFSVLRWQFAVVSTMNLEIGADAVVVGTSCSSYPAVSIARIPATVLRAIHMVRGSDPKVIERVIDTAEKAYESECCTNSL